MTIESGKLGYKKARQNVRLFSGTRIGDDHKMFTDRYPLNFAQRGKPLDSTWIIYGSGIQRYESDFHKVFGFDKIIPYIKEVIEHKQGCSVLDLMGEGQVLRDIRQQCDISGLAVSLSDMRQREKREYDARHDITLLHNTEEEPNGGNIILGKVWRDMEKWLNDHNVQGFDMILCHPEGGIDFIPKTYGMYYKLLRRMYTIMASDGVLLTQLPKDLIWEEKFHQWLDLAGNSGLVIKVGSRDYNSDPNPAMMLRKTNESPVELPKIE